MITKRRISPHKFPRHLAKAVISEWNTLVAGPEYDRPPLPPTNLLRQLLEVCYLASLETDEGRPLKFTVCCTPNVDVIRQHCKDILIESWRLEGQREFDLTEVRRLAATTDLDSSAIWVNYQLKGEPKLLINGLINQGSTWASARRAFAYEYIPPPSALIVRVTGNGRLSVYQGNYLVATLASGRINEGTIGLLEYLGVYGFLRSGAEFLRPQIEGLEQYLPTMEPQEHEPLRERLEFEWMAYVNTILAIINVIQSKGHGGALILTQYDADILRRQDLIKIKYKFNVNNCVLQQRFVNFIQLRNRTYDYWWKKMRESDSPVPDDVLFAADAKTKDSFQTLTETAIFIGNLAGADGAIVLTNSLCTIGFSAEIIAEKAVNSSVYAITDPIKKEGELLDMEQYGMRHRSAIKLCSNTDDAIVFVVSQDGDVSLVWGDGKDVMVKRGINTSNVGMIMV